LIPSSGVVFGAAALALGAAATAYALDQARRRKEEEARRRAEMARRNAAAERADAEWRATMAAILATAEAARRLKQAKDDARLERKEAKLEPKVPPRATPLDMAKLKQADYAAAEEWERERAYAVYRDGERQSVPIVPPVVALPWWQKVWEDAKQTQRTVVDWIDQHQAAVSIAVGVVAAATVIVLTAGTATPLVVAGLAALAAGGSVALGTVNLNAHYDRPWSENLLRNTAYGLGGAGVVVGGWAVLRSGALTSAVLGAGNAVAGFCAKTPACARLEPALQLVDTGEQLFLSAQLAVQTATRDPRAGETYIELQLELADGGAPGNTAIRELQQELGEAVGRYGPEVLDPVAALVRRHGDEALQFIQRHGDEGMAFLARYQDDAFALAALHGPEVVSAFGRYGDDGVSVVEEFGSDFLRRSEKLGVDPTEVLTRPPSEGQTLEGWLLGIADRENPVNRSLAFHLSDDTIQAVAETSVHNPDSPLFAVGFSQGAGVIPYDSFGERFDTSYFRAPDGTYQRFADSGALGDFWQINARAIEQAMADRKIFVLNVPFEDAASAARSSTLAELSLILTGDYVRKTVAGYDFLVPVELADTYLSIVEQISPTLLTP
jgi:hypothetical protein